MSLTSDQCTQHSAIAALNVRQRDILYIESYNPLPVLSAPLHPFAIYGTGSAGRIPHGRQGGSG